MVSGKQHTLLWVSVLAMSFLGWPALTTAPEIMRQVHSEVEMMANAFGVKEAKQIVDQGNNVYNVLFIESGMSKGVDKVYAKQEGREAEAMVPAVSGLATMTNSYWLTFTANVYRMALRVLVLLTWLPYIAPFLFAIIVDGVVLRKIKLSSYGYMSPMRYSLGMHMVIASIFFPLLYLLAPLPVTPFFPPYWALMLALPGVMMVSNVQRMAAD